MEKPRRNKIYEFENFRLDAEHLLLYKSGREVALTPKVVETLLALVERSGEVLSKDELMEIVWADSFVEEGNLSQNLYILRKTFPDTINGKPLIETLKRRGYRFNGDVSCVGTNLSENSLRDENKLDQSKVALENVAHAGLNGDAPAAADYQADERSEIEINNFQSPAAGNLSTLVGREREISEIKKLLSQTDARLITLAGVGGAGKTRLAQAVAREMTENFSDGAVFIELAAITDHELVAPTIAQKFGIGEAGGKPLLENLKERLRDKKMLLVVDNFEQVIDAAPVIVQLLAAAAHVKFLITSRVRLRLSAEREFIVPPLALPDENSIASAADLSEYEAVKLFVERARNAKSNFVLTNENAPEVAKICARLDGLPLAIELAAARIKIISPRAILSKLEHSLRLLTGGAHDLPLRQQTMRGAVEWSYNLLDEDEKRLFRRLAVFAGGFTIEAAEAICDDFESSREPQQEIGDRLEVLDIITSLIDKSLLASQERADDEQRFQMLEVVREYALDALEKNDEAEALRRSHAAYFLRLGEAAEPQLNTAQAGEWLKRLEDEHNNLRFAIRWLLKNELEMAARLAAAIRLYLVNRSHLTEGREWLTAVLEKGSALPADLRFKLSYGLSFLAVYQGDYATARKIFEASLTEARAIGSQERVAESLRGLGTVAYSQGDYPAARKFLEEGLAISRELDYKFGIAALLNGLGSLALDEGNGAKARALLEESLTYFRLLGNENGICFCLLNLGAVAYSGDDFAAARKYYGETVSVAQNLSYKDRISLCLDGFAALAVKRGKWQHAAKLAGAAERLREQIGYESEPIDRQRRDAYLSELQTKMDKEVLSNLIEQGRKLKLEEAVALCQ